MRFGTITAIGFTAARSWAPTRARISLPMAAALAAVAGMTALSSPAQAASANASFGCCSDPSVNTTGNGFATAEKSSSRGFAQGNAYEFKGGVGVSAFAATTGTGGALAQASGIASITDTIHVGEGMVSDLGSASVFLLTIPIVMSGTATVSAGVYAANPAWTSISQASYDWSWSAGNQSGGGVHTLFKDYDKPLETIDTSYGDAAALLFVHIGDVVTLNFYARARATAWPLGTTGGSAAADFSHTLRWGGVQNIQGFDADGNEVDLGDDFRLSLMSDDNSFDYFDAAAENPYTAAPEPAAWAMMLAGFGLTGAALRRRKRVPLAA